jgi:hypothetical protein
MDIHVVSTLTTDDEDRIADVLAVALADLLDGLPISYALRIETIGAKVIQRTNLEIPNISELPLLVPGQQLQ